MDGLKRYDLYFDGYKAEMQEQDHDSYGEYVKYDDILPLIEAVRFYGNKENWRSDTDLKCLLSGEFLNTSWGVIARDDNGKTAREALKKAGIE